MRRRVTIVPVIRDVLPQVIARDCNHLVGSPCSPQEGCLLEVGQGGGTSLHTSEELPEEGRLLGSLRSEVAPVSKV